MKKSTPFAFDVTTWGETMLRFSPPYGVALERALAFEVFSGGAESNTAVALARFGIRTSWVSRLPNTPLGHRVAGEIAFHGVDVSQVVWALDQERMGLCFIEPGTPPRPSKVYYDRTNSALAKLTPSELNYDHLAKGKVLLLTGITPALGSACQEAWLRSAQVAHQAGSQVFLDVNHRNKLWSYAQAAQVLAKALPYVHFLTGGLEDLRHIFTPSQPAISAPELAKDLASRYALPFVLITLGEQGALGFEAKSQTLAQSKAHKTQSIDRIGSGDAFNAGFLYGLLKHHDWRKGLGFGTASAALKRTYWGDFSWARKADLLALECGAPSGGSVQR